MTPPCEIQSRTNLSKKFLTSSMPVVSFYIHLTWMKLRYWVCITWIALQSTFELRELRIGESSSFKYNVCWIMYCVCMFLCNGPFCNDTVHSVGDVEFWCNVILWSSGFLQASCIRFIHCFYWESVLDRDLAIMLYQFLYCLLKWFCLHVGTWFRSHLIVGVDEDVIVGTN